MQDPRMEIRQMKQNNPHLVFRLAFANHILRKVKPYLLWGIANRPLAPNKVCERFACHLRPNTILNTYDSKLS